MSAGDAMASGRRHLVLAGGGHAHLEVLRTLIHAPLTRGRVSLISPFATQHYSSMVPGFLRGVTAADTFAFDLAALCEAAGVRFVRGRVERIDPEARTLHVRPADGPDAQSRGDAPRAGSAASLPLTYDVLSVDVGSAPTGAALPGVAEHAYPVRPMARAIALEARLGALLAGASREPVPIVVVGAGAAGVETALALAVRARGAGESRATVTLISVEPEPLPGFPTRARRCAAGRLADAGVRFLGSNGVRAVTADAVRLATDESLPSALTVWMTGAAPPSLFAASPSLGTDAAGWLPVDATLRATEHAAIYGAGDAVSFPGRPDVAKAGVYAVHAAPTLAHNLRVAIDGGTPRTYAPQRSFLALLDTADGRALLRWRGIVLHARWAKWLKDRIDRRFLQRYQSLVA